MGLTYSINNWNTACRFIIGVIYVLKICSVILLFIFKCCKDAKQELWIYTHHPGCFLHRRRQDILNVICIYNVQAIIFQPASLTSVKYT